MARVLGRIRGRDFAGGHPASGEAGFDRGKGVARKEAAEPSFSAPMPRLPDTGRTFPSSLGHGLSGRQLADTKKPPRASDQPAGNLQAEAASLEEVLKNQSHPKNLVAIKKSGTPVVATPSLNGKTLFLADAQDEFEMLDFNADWVHVRISGLSRGWIWRTSLEMPEGISDVPTDRATCQAGGGRSVSSERAKRWRRFREIGSRCGARM